jgi:hypothetical protein
MRALSARAGVRAASAAAALTALVLALSGGGPAGATTRVPVPPTASPKGVGELRFGRSLDRLQRQGLVGRARRGCVLAPQERVALLRPPLEGIAHFYPGERLSAINVTAGAVTSTGVRIGSSAGEARKAYPGAIYDPPPARIPTLPGYLWVGGRFHSRLTLVIGNHSRRVLEIAIPYPSLCE